MVLLTKTPKFHYEGPTFITSSNPNHIPKSISINTTTLRLGLQYMNFEGHKHVTYNCYGMNFSLWSYANVNTEH